MLNRTQKIISRIAENRGSMFNPLVTDAFLEASESESFWLDLQPQMIFDLVNLKKPKVLIHITPDEMMDIAIAYSKIIDNKSTYTYNHSNAFALAAEFLSDKFSFSRYEKTMIKIAGYLHDLGKLAIPNEILDKPSQLTHEEFLIIKKHTYYSYRLIQTIPGFELIASRGPYHHERLDVSGYPFRLKSDQIPLGAKIMAVSDMFAALTEDRPYRKGMSRKECLDILKKESSIGHIDPKVVDYVELYYNELLSLTKKHLKDHCITCDNS